MLTAPTVVGTLVISVKEEDYSFAMKRDEDAEKNWARAPGRFLTGTRVHADDLTGAVPNAELIQPAVNVCQPLGVQKAYAMGCEHPRDGGVCCGKLLVGQSVQLGFHRAASGVVLEKLDAPDIHRAY